MAREHPRAAQRPVAPDADLRRGPDRPGRLGRGSRGALARAPGLPGTLHDLQRARILATFGETGNNVSETARRLGVSRNTIYRALGQGRAETTL